MKICFYDIDGVVATNRSLNEELSRYFGIPIKELLATNTNDWCDKTGLDYPDVDMYSWPFDQRCINNTYLLHQRTKCKFVMSSSWRCGRTIEEINDLMSKKGLKVPFMGMTEYTTKKRGEEIQDWLDLFPVNYPNEILESYVIIDDECNYDIIQFHPNNCVCTTQEYGFQKRHLDRAIRILNKNDNEK